MFENTQTGLGIHSSGKQGNKNFDVGLISGLTFLENEENTIDSWGKGTDPECQTSSYKHYVFSPVQCSRYCGPHGKIIYLNNHTLVDWTPHGKFLNSCSDDVNKTVCDGITEIVWNGTWQGGQLSLFSKH